MKTYPSIEKTIVNRTIYAFDKLDGSNIRAEWSRKKGFCKFGSRHHLIDETDKLLGKAPGLIMEKYSEILSQIFFEIRWQKAVAFFEYYGPRSFAGSHHPEDDHNVTLFDVSGDRGLIEPKDFVRSFGNLDIAKVLYVGMPTNDLIEDVKEGRLTGMTFEGVVCKGPHVSPGLPLMFKIKSNAWLTTLKETCKTDEEFMSLM